MTVDNTSIIVFFSLRIKIIWGSAIKNRKLINKCVPTPCASSKYIQKRVLYAPDSSKCVETPCIINEMVSLPVVNTWLHFCVTLVSNISLCSLSVKPQFSVGIIIYRWGQGRPVNPRKATWLSVILSRAQLHLANECSLRPLLGKDVLCSMRIHSS